MTAFDYKKEYKEFYLPPKKPQMIEIPSMNFLAVRGKGNPNEAEGDYKKSIGLLYGVAYTIKMSKMGSHKMDGFFSVASRSAQSNSSFVTNSGRRIREIHWKSTFLL